MRAILPGKPPWRPCAALLLAVALGACRTAPPPAPPGPLPGARPPVAAAQLERLIHDEVNRERAAHRLAPLELDESLSRIARGHSEDMAARGYFDHRSPEGRDLLSRYREAGYACAVRTGSTIRLGAENLCLQHLYRSVTTVGGVAIHDWSSPDDVAARTVREWMKSPGHRDNLLTPWWRRQGVGVAVAPDGAVYVTQDFC